MVTIEATIRPYSYRREEIQVGRMIDGRFVQERGVWNVLKDSRLSVKRDFDGRGAQTDVTFTIQIPDGYDMVIAKYSITDVSKSSPDKSYSVLYDPFADPALIDAIAHMFDGLVEAVKAAEAEKSRVKSRFERDELDDLFKKDEEKPMIPWTYASEFPDDALEFDQYNVAALVADGVIAEDDLADMRHEPRDVAKEALHNAS